MAMRFGRRAADASTTAKMITKTAASQLRFMHSPVARENSLFFRLRLQLRRHNRGDGTMSMPDDDLLPEFLTRRDEAAFREIVGRDLRLVPASARRQIHDSHPAEDVTQAVFIMLANKAPTLRHGNALASWLVTSTR